MGWQDQIIAPERKTPPRRRIRYVCPGLCRFASMVSTLAVALGSYYGGVVLFGLEAFDWSAPSWTGKRVGLIIASAVLGLIAGLFGFGAAMTLEVRSERLNILLTTLWQFLAIGLMVWTVVIVFAMYFSLGTEETGEAVKLFGFERAIVHIFITGSIVGLLMGIAYLLALIIDVPVMGGFAFAAAISLMATRWHYAVYDIAGTGWIVAGLITSALVFLLAPTMIARDQEERRLILERTQ